MRNTTDQFPATPGHDALWIWFELSRAGWLTLPRVMMHDMPDDWQARMAQLLNEWDDHWKNLPEFSTHVSIKLNGRFVRTPPAISNYRHPSREALDYMKGDPK